MPVGGKLKLKGGLHVKQSGLAKKNRKSASKGARRKEETQNGDGNREESATSLKPYEEEFDLEMKKLKQSRAAKTVPEVLHGYAAKVRGDTAEERLDLRAAMKSDKFCK